MHNLSSARDGTFTIVQFNDLHWSDLRRGLSASG